MRSSSNRQRSRALHQRWIAPMRWAAPLTLAFAQQHGARRSSGPRSRAQSPTRTGRRSPTPPWFLKTPEPTGRFTATSNESGVYNFNALPPDQFTLTVTANGFKQKAIQNLAITPEQANSVNVQLDLGESSTTVTVSGDTVPAIDTASANLTGTISTNDIQHLPSAGRDVFQLARSWRRAPSATGNRVPAGEPTAFPAHRVRVVPVPRRGSLPQRTDRRPFPAAVSMRPTAFQLTASARPRRCGAERPSSRPTRTRSTTSRSPPTATTPSMAASAAPICR